MALFLNATMFVVGLIAGIIAESTGLIADSLDMLADALAYAIALIAVMRSTAFKAQAAGVSGTVLLVLGVGVLLDVLRRGVFGASPESTIMIVVAGTALCVNSFVLYQIDRYRQGEVHLRATWIFTRVDVIANIAVICSAVLIRLTGFRWLDLFIGAAIGVYVIREALEILSNARLAKAAL